MAEDFREDLQLAVMQDLPEPEGNRRRVPRRPIHQKVGVLHRGKYQLCWAYEIGEGGILIDYNGSLNVGDRLVVTVRIPGVLQGVMISQVVYALPVKAAGDPVKYGLQFEKIEFDIRRKMRNYVASSTV